MAFKGWFSYAASSGDSNHVNWNNRHDDGNHTNFYRLNFDEYQHHVSQLAWQGQTQRRFFIPSREGI